MILKLHHYALILRSILSPSIFLIFVSSAHLPESFDLHLIHVSFQSHLSPSKPLDSVIHIKAPLPGTSCSLLKFSFFSFFLFLSEPWRYTGDGNNQGRLKHGKYQDNAFKLENLSQHCTQVWQVKRPILRSNTSENQQE